MAGSVIDSQRQRRFGQDKQDKLPRFCLECDVRFACHGGCPKNRFTSTPDGEAGLNYLCVGYKLFFHHVEQPMRIMADLLRRGRAPASVMHILANEELRQLRQAFAGSKPNDSCPCGSGRLFRVCHGKKK